MLVLRTCTADLTSYHGFKWPESGPVAAPDWRDDFNCGHGLHGLPWGEGDGSLLSWEEDAKWLVVEVLDETVKHGQGDMVLKCKFPAGEVVFCGDRQGATEYLYDHGGQGRNIVGFTATAGDEGILQIKWWDGKRYRIETAYVGEKKIMPNTRYRLDTSGKKPKFVEDK